VRRPGRSDRVAGTPLLIVLAMAQFMVVLDFTIVDVALPSIQTGLHIGTSEHHRVVVALIQRQPRDRLPRRLDLAPHREQGGFPETRRAGDEAEAPIRPAPKPFQKPLARNDLIAYRRRAQFRRDQDRPRAVRHPVTRRRVVHPGQVRCVATRHSDQLGVRNPSITHHTATNALLVAAGSRIDKAVR
jgi:hypothetical protein